MVYSSKNWLTQRVGPIPFDVWVAQYAEACEYPNPAFWQFSNSGTVSGIDGRVDLNFQFKDYSNIIIPYGLSLIHISKWWDWKRTGFILPYIWMMMKPLISGIRKRCV